MNEDLFAKSVDNTSSVRLHHIIHKPTLTLA